MDLSSFDVSTPYGTILLSFAAAIAVAIASWVVRPIRRYALAQFVRLFARIQSLGNAILGNEVVRVFADRRSLDQHLLNDFKRTKRVYMITGRGIQLQAESPFTYLLNERNPDGAPIDVRILLPAPKPTQDTINWTEVNEQSLRAIDPAYSKNTLSKQIEASIEVLNTYQASRRIDGIKFFNMPHIARIIITDSGVYMNPYNEERLSLRNRVVKFRLDSETGKLWERLFRLLWSNPYLQADDARTESSDTEN